MASASGIILIKDNQILLDLADFALQEQPEDNRPFPSSFEPHYEREAKCKVFVMKISFHSYANKTNFHMKSIALF